MPNHMDLGPFKVGFSVPPVPLLREGGSWGRAAAPPAGRPDRADLEKSRPDGCSCRRDVGRTWAVCAEAVAPLLQRAALRSGYQG